MRDHAPALYNPDPEIFFERSRNAVYPQTGQPRKVLFNAGSDSADRLLCPTGRRLAPGLPVVELRGGWRYLNAAPACQPR